MKLYKYLLVFFIPLSLMVSCKKSTFVKDNIDPTTLLTVDPGNQFLSAVNSLPNDFEAYYDYLRGINSWMQYSTPNTGNGPGFTNPIGNFDYRYGNFYGNVGNPLADIPHLISTMSAANQAGRIYENSIATIVKAFYAFYVSDINGSVPYSQAFKARYGGTLTPVYDPQESLFDTLDTQIAAAVTTLEATQSTSQVSYGGYDPIYGGNNIAWAKAGNALRLKIAMRLLKRNPTAVQTIATAVLADANQFAANSDAWVVYFGASKFTQGSNYNPQGFLAAKPMVDFMQATGDPRLPIFYRKNSFNQYVGSPTNPDTCSLASYQAEYLSTVDTFFSPVQHRLFTPNFNENDGFGVGTGVGFFPIITYAEYCFIRAELGARGITTDDAATWYTNGVTASIQFYDQMAGSKGVQISNYTPVTQGQITSYLGQTGITYDASKGIEQIACQAYVDFYRQPSEAWAWWKRTGFPTTTSVLPWSVLTSNGAVLPITRRASLTPFSNADANYANQTAAYAAMATDPGFGSSPSDAFGRVWWDMQ